jgi:hypothetical protein
VPVGVEVGEAAVGIRAFEEVVVFAPWCLVLIIFSYAAPLVCFFEVAIDRNATDADI